MKSLNMKMKLKLVSLVLVWAMVLCINPVARADSPERFAGPSASRYYWDCSDVVSLPAHFLHETMVALVCGWVVTVYCLCYSYCAGGGIAAVQRFS